MHVADQRVNAPCADRTATLTGMWCTEVEPQTQRDGYTDYYYYYFFLIKILLFFFTHIIIIIME